MTDEVGIKETKEMIGFIVELGNGVGKSLEDGEWNVTDFVHFMDALMMAPAAFQGMNQIPAEFGDLSEAEIKELVDYVVEEFDIPQDQIEVVIERAIDIAWDIYELIKMIGQM